MTWQSFDSWFSSTSLRRAREFRNQEMVDVWESMRRPRATVTAPGAVTSSPMSDDERDSLEALLLRPVWDAARAVAVTYGRHDRPGSDRESGGSDVSEDDLFQYGFEYAWRKYAPGTAELAKVLAIADADERHRKIQVSVAVELRAIAGTAMGDRHRCELGGVAVATGDDPMAWDEDMLDLLVKVALSPKGVNWREKRRWATREQANPEFRGLLVQVEEEVKALGDLHLDVITKHVV